MLLTNKINCVYRENMSFDSKNLVTERLPTNKFLPCLGFGLGSGAIVQGAIFLVPKNLIALKFDK